MRESIYLSFNKSVDWQKGLGTEIDWSDGQVQIASRHLYVLEKNIKSAIYGLADGDQVIVSTSGMIYVIKADGDLYGIDWRLEQMDLLDYGILSHEDLSKDLIYFAANNRIYCLEQIEKRIKIRIYSLLNRCWIRSYEIKLETALRSVAMDDGLLICLDRQNNFYWYDLDKGHYKGQAYLTGYELPEGYKIKNMSISGVILTIDDGRENLNRIRITSGGAEQIDAHPYNHQIRAFEDQGKRVYKDKVGHIYVLSNNLTIDVYRYTTIYGNQGLHNLSKGVYYFPIIDSGVEGNQWHRLILKGHFPEKTHINLKYFAFDRENLKIAYRKEMLALLENKADSYLEVDQVFEQLTYTTIDDSDDFLFQEAMGRYIIIRMELIGSRELTPKIEKARLYLNRETYSQYLPEIYQTGDHKDFIERFLSIFESINLEVEEQIDLMSRNFNPKTASRDFLKWMLSWMDFRVSDNWSTEQLRHLIQLMPNIQRRRGTVWTIKQLLELFLNADIMIVENSRILGESFDHSPELTELLKKHYGSSPYSFTVLSSRANRLTEGELEDVKVILDQETPPYCQYQFIELEHGMFLDKHSYLGLNTALTDYSSFRLNNETLLPFNTLLQEE